MNLYIGLDAHSATSTAVVVDERGEIKLRETFSTSEANLIGFIRRLPQSATLHLTLEECHLAQWLYLTLVEHVDVLIVCNPVYLAKKPGAKTDFRDALHLAQELRTGHLKPVHHESSRWIELRTLVSGYLALVEEIVRSKNRLKAVFRANGLATDTEKFYTTPKRAKELPHDSARFVAESLFVQIERLEEVKRTSSDQPVLTGWLMRLFEVCWCIWLLTVQHVFDERFEVLSWIDADEFTRLDNRKKYCSRQCATL